MWFEFTSEFSRQLTPQIWQLIEMSTFETIYMSLIFIPLCYFIWFATRYIEFSYPYWASLRKQKN